MQLAPYRTNVYCRIYAWYYFYVHAYFLFSIEKLKENYATAMMSSSCIASVFAIIIHDNILENTNNYHLLKVSCNESGETFLECLNRVK
jgi:hypothetical protein